MGAARSRAIVRRPAARSYRGVAQLPASAVREGSERRIGPSAVVGSTGRPRCVATNSPASASPAATARIRGISARQAGSSAASARAISEGHRLLPGPRAASAVRIAAATVSAEIGSASLPGGRGLLCWRREEERVGSAEAMDGSRAVGGALLVLVLGTLWVKANVAGVLAPLARWLPF